MIFSASKKFLTSIVLSSALIFSYSANANPPSPPSSQNSTKVKMMPKTPPNFCSKKNAKNCVDRRDYLKKSYQEYIRKIDMLGRNPNSKGAKLSKVTKLMERSFLEECDFDANLEKSKAASETYLYNCQVATYAKLIRKIESHPDVLKAK